jgi:hypothetical protein
MVDLDSAFNPSVVEEDMFEDGQPKILACLFWLDVLCIYVKREGFTGVMDRCMKCSHYFRFLRVMAEEDEKCMDEIDRMRRYKPDG